MLPLEAKATLVGWQDTQQVKVAGLPEFAAGRVPVERMLLDCRGTSDGAAFNELRQLPWAGFLLDAPTPTDALRPTVVIQGDARIVQPGDVVEVRPSLSKVAVRHRRGDNGNVLFATERCNSFCLMCSQPPRMVDDQWRVAQLCDLIPLIDPDEPSLAISGGEPTLLGAGLLDVVRACGTHLPDTHLHILSNGRRMADTAYANTFTGAHPSLSWGVPLYGDHAALHDFVVHSPGAFGETLRGIYALHAAGQRIEIRVVLVKPVVPRLAALARFIYRNLPFVDHVALMGLEPIGLAKAHPDVVWTDPVDMVDELSAATLYLADRGLNVSLYNMQLCTLPRALWPFAQRSISNWKQDYAPACTMCAVRERCAGFFTWATEAWRSRAIAPVTETTETMHV